MTYRPAVERLLAVIEKSRHIAVTLPNGVPNVAAARVRLAEGVPALAGEPLFDYPTLAAAVARLGGDVARLRYDFDEPSLCETALAATWDTMPRKAHGELITLVEFAVRPFLRAGYSAVRESIVASDWTRGTCPACGVLPLLAEIRADKEGHTRILRCLRCTAAWAFPRVACPACPERNAAKLRYVHVEGEVDRLRAECCLTCGFYVKAVARLDPVPDDDLMMVDLDTVALDTLAMMSGHYRVGSEPAPPFISA
jgi:hypothetical protein